MENVLIGSWNLAGGMGLKYSNVAYEYEKEPNSVEYKQLAEQMALWLGKANDKKTPCWLVIVGLQELVPYPNSPSSVTEAALKFWKLNILNAIGEEEFSLTASCRLGAIVQFVFVRKSHDAYVLRAEGVGLPKGLAGLANKGAVAVQLVVRGSLLAGTDSDIMHMRFVTCHLTPFNDKAFRRDEELRAIFRNMSFPFYSSGQVCEAEKRSVEAADVQKDYSVASYDRQQNFLPFVFTTTVADAGYLDCVVDQNSALIMADYLFVFGDLNYRIDFKSSDRELLSRLKDGERGNSTTELAAHDQLHARLRASSGKLPPLFEGGFNKFLPTYKYRILNEPKIIDGQLSSADCSRYTGTEYNWTRIPGWCDRILFFFQHHPKEYDIFFEAFSKSLASTPKSRFKKIKKSSKLAAAFKKKVLPIAVLHYFSVDSFCLSDHKPICGVFTLAKPLYVDCPSSEYRNTQWWTFQSLSYFNTLRAILYRIISVVYWFIYDASIVLYNYLISQFTSSEAAGSEETERLILD